MTRTAQRVVILKLRPSVVPAEAIKCRPVPLPPRGYSSTAQFGFGNLPRKAMVLAVW